MSTYRRKKKVDSYSTFIMQSGRRVYIFSTSVFQIYDAESLKLYSCDKLP